jgi:sugar/nucleoside kinase (ribokinase family)
LAAPAPTFVIVGHVTQDVVPNGLAVGGATYSARMARSLGQRVGLVTSAADDFNFARALPGVEVARVSAPHTSTFENRYFGDRRDQYVRAAAAKLDPSAIPPTWRDAEIAMLAPFTNEVMPGVEAAFADVTLVAATPQGWLRRWGGDGLVRLEGWSTLIGRLSKLRAVVLSEDDVQRDEATVDMLRRAIPLLVVTRGARGGTLFRDGEPFDYPPFPANEVDPTGAGDGFAAAFLIELRRTGDPVQACLFGSCAASFVVEAPGAEGIPTPAQIAARLTGGPRR